MPSENAGAFSIQSFTSSEAGAWSNAYLISHGGGAVVFDVPMLRSDAIRLADVIEQSGKAVAAIMISHAHPDHFMGLDVVTARFPRAPVVSTANVVADIRNDGPGMLAMLQGKFGAEGPTRLVLPEPLRELAVTVDGARLEVLEFGEGEAAHTATLHVPDLKALFAADLVYNNAHLYLAERHLDSWLARLSEVEAFACDRISTIYPGHGAPGDIGLIAQTRRYLQDFAEALNSGDAATCERQMLSRYPHHHARQFLAVFSLPAFFPSAANVNP
jgi:glyoxylase-like metal-dependent hydrolase (beta-lactamase superfamily II)